MRKILVPLDGSLPSIRALEYVAARQRRGEKLSVVVLHAQPNVRPNIVVNRSMIDEWKIDELKRVISSPKVKTLIKRLKAKVQTETGDPANCIIRYAKKARCHEIVMGTRGNGGMKKLLMGSVATKVAQLAEMPVTLVK